MNIYAAKWFLSIELDYNKEYPSLMLIHLIIGKNDAKKHEKTKTNTKKDQ